MPEPVSAKPVPKLRAKSANKPPGRPRPKTIHVDQDADMSSALGSRGPRGSISNISGKFLEPLLAVKKDLLRFFKNLIWDFIAIGMIFHHCFKYLKIVNVWICFEF